MTEDKKIKQSRRLFSKLLALTSGFPRVLLAGDTKPIPRIPLVLKWDVQPANSQIEQEFLVKEYRNYYVYLEFNRAPPVDVKELRRFTGDGAYQIVTKDPVPTVINPQTTEEVRRADELVRQGVYEFRHIHLGVMMPVHVTLEKLGDDINTTPLTIVDETFNTDRGCFGLDRAITEVALKPGKYRIKLKTLQETYLPPGADSSLVITFRPKTRVLVDK